MLIRSATPADIQIILDLVRDLAIYEKEESQAKATPEQIERALFSPNPTAYCELVEVEDGSISGFALWFNNYSTWTGNPGLSECALADGIPKGTTHEPWGIAVPSVGRSRPND